MAKSSTRALTTIMRLWERNYILFLAIGAVLAADQFTKYLVSSGLALGESLPAHGTFRITYTYNTGSAFGLFQDKTLFLLIASGVAIGVLLWFYRSHPYRPLLFQLSLGLQLGGAVGNLTDRLLFGKVVDFIGLGWWPVFNLADASIVTGILILAMLFLYPRRLGTAKASTSEEALSADPPRQPDE